MEVKLSSVYGFCSGVKNALKIASDTLDKYPNKKIYLLNKIVHNQVVVDSLTQQGIITLDDERSLEDKIKSLQDGVVIFSAHGHDKKLDDICNKQNLIIVDAVCPRVTLNHKSMIDTLNQGKTVVYIGITNHPETIASLALSSKIKFIDFKNPDYSILKQDDEVVVHNQTTLIQSTLETIIKNIASHVKSCQVKNDICFATAKRQACLNEVSDEDAIFIIGDKISSNSTRLYEVAKSHFPDKKVYQISNLNEVKTLSLSNIKKGFVTAGASTPDEVINPIVAYLKTI